MGLFDGLFGGGDTSQSSTPFDSGFGDRLNALFLAMASTPPGGAGGIPLLQATQLTNQQSQMQAQRNAMTQALIMGGMDPKQAAILSYNPAAAQMGLNMAQQKAAVAATSAANASSPPMPGDVTATPPMPQAPMTTAPQAPSLPQSPPQTVPSVSSIQTRPVNPAVAPSAMSPVNMVDGGSGAPALTAPPAMNLPGSEANASAPTEQFGSKPELATAIRAQSSAPPPPNQTQTYQQQLAQWRAYRNHWNGVLANATNKNWEGLKTLADNNVKLADKYLSPESNPDLQATIKGQEAAATFPYQAGITAMREAARPITVGPNQVVTTGAQVNPALNSILNNIAKTAGGQQASVPGQTQLAQNDGTLPAGGPGVSQFTPRLVQNPDGSFSSSVTPGQEAIQTQAAKDYEESGKTARAAQQMQYRLSLVEHSLDKLNVTPDMYNTGATANARLGVMKTVNSVAQAAGLPAPFDPSKVASWEDLNKENIQLGFSLSRTLGARVAMQMVQQAIAANPGALSTPQGAKLVLNSLRMSAKADSDYFDYITKYASEHGGDLVSAQSNFYKENPPQSYASAAIAAGTAPNHVQYLKAHQNDPKVVSQFDDKYGPGSAKIILGMP